MVKWTDDQLKAIESPGGTLLVSAAAGSGKTAVLVERLLRRVMNEKIDIDKFLMITYTNAAASELRSKIISALSGKIAENPRDKHLAKQMRIVHRANISTIHAFCTQVLRTHGHLVNVPGDFKIVDENEAKILKLRALDDLLEEEYEKNDEAFGLLCDYLGGERDDKKIAETIVSLHAKSKTHPNPKKWLDTCASMYEDESTVWENEVISHIREISGYMKSRLEVLLNSVTSDSIIAEAYYPTLLDDMESIDNLCAADGWDEMVAAINSIKFTGLSPAKGTENEVLKNAVKSERDWVKKEVEALKVKYLCRSHEKIVSEIRTLKPVARKLCSLAAELDARFGEAKIARGELDYADLEHKALELFLSDYDEVNDIVTPTELARELSLNFYEIMVDEYQDSNCIQDVIFRSVSKNESNLTMVGDLKQSIYRFRLADPTIFLRKYKAFAEYDSAGKGEPRVVNLSKNFRSRAEVLDACNRYFSMTMSERLGEIDYTEREYLNPEAKYEKSDIDCSTELVVIDLKEEGADEELSYGAREIEARYIASRIIELEANGVNYGDIVILLRSLSGRAGTYEKVLREFGIPCVCERNEGVLGTVEAGILISFLQTIDNPLWDVSLVSTLRSPLFGFTADDLAYIRREKRGFFYDAVRLAAKKDSATGKKCNEFIELLEEFRTLSGEIGADELIWKLLDRTRARGMFGAMENGNVKVSHLHDVYRAAERFEQGGFKGLHAFLNYISKIIEAGGDIASASSMENTNAVRIMSIHKSKGLEFPIVFMADCNRRFNEMDLREQVIVHPKFGIGLNYRNLELRSQNPTIAKQCIEIALRNEMKSEELRILYVAMTRAKEKLIMLCTEKNAASRIEKAIGMFSGKEISPIALLRAHSADLWFLLPNLADEKMFKFANVKKVEIPAPEVSFEAEEERHADEAQVAELRARFSFEYPYNEAVNIESKLTATGIAHSGMSRRHHFLRPQFKKAEGLSPTERGIALHLAMQLIDFSKCETLQGVKTELLRLRDGAYLSDEQFDVIDAEKIYAFFCSGLGKLALNSENMRREFAFSRLVKVAGDDTALLQGVIDLMFEHNGEIVLVDFKSDRTMDEDVKKQYARQLDVYAEAIEAIMKRKVSSRHIYYLRHSCDVVL